MGLQEVLVNSSNLQPCTLKLRSLSFLTHLVLQLNYAGTVNVLESPQNTNKHKREEEAKHFALDENASFLASRRIL